MTTVLCSDSYCILCREKTAEVSSDVVNALFFLEEFIHYGQMPRKVIYMRSCDPLYEIM